MRPWNERDDETAAFDPFNGQIARLDAKLLADPFVDGDLEPVADNVCHIDSVAYEFPAKYVVGVLNGF